jgi:O-antigen/teichoic acid export membrane protein
MAPLSRVASGTRHRRKTEAVRPFSLLDNRYIRSAAAGVTGRGLALLSGLLGTWAATRLLDRNAYGTAILAIQVAGFLGTVAPVGLDSLTLFRGAQRRSTGQARALITASFLRVCASSMITILMVGIVLSLAGKALDPATRWWFLAALPLVPLFALNQLAVAFSLGQDHVIASILVPRLGDVLRSVILMTGLLLVSTGAARYVASAYLIGALAPVAVWIALLRPWGVASEITREDWSYSKRMVGAQIAQQGLRKIDIMMLGVLAATGSVGDYAIGAQFAAVVVLGHEVLSPALIPRFAELVARRELKAAGVEYTMIQTLSFSGSLVLAAALVAIEPIFHAVFPGYPLAYGVMLTLAAALTAKVGFGITGRALALLGLSGWSLATNFTLLGLVIALNFALIPAFGARGAALGTCLAFFTVNFAKYVAVIRVGKVRSLSALVPACLVPACGALLARAFELIRSSTTIGLLLACLGLVVFANRSVLRSAAHLTIGRFGKRAAE